MLSIGRACAYNMPAFRVHDYMYNHWLLHVGVGGCFIEIFLSGILLADWVMCEQANSLTVHKSL